MKRIILSIIAILTTISLVVIGLLLAQQAAPADKGSVTANQQAGVAQAGDTAQQNGNEQNQANNEETTPPIKRTDPELLEVILQKEPSLTGVNNQPLVTIARAQKTANAWYVVTLKHKDPTVTNAKVILKDNGGSAGLVIIAGPGTYFDPETIYLPNEVRALL